MADNSLGAKTGVPVVLPVITEWTAYTPTLNTGARGTGTEKAYWRRVGSSMEIQYSHRQTAAGTAGSGTYTMALPTGYTIDTNQITLFDSSVGAAYANNGTSDYDGFVTPATSTTLALYIYTAATTVALANSTNLSYGLTARVVEFQVSVPIAEWAGSANVAYGAGLATSVKSGLTPATATLGSLRVHTSNGYGSTNTRTRRFTTTVLTQGTGFTFNQSATLGDDVTITVDGIYAFHYTDEFSAVGNMGLSKNSSQLATDIGLITAATRLTLATTGGANYAAEVSWTGYCAAGDVIRAHTDTSAAGATPAKASLSVQRLA